MSKYKIILVLLHLVITNIYCQELHFEKAQDIISDANYIRLNKKTGNIEYFELKPQKTIKKQKIQFEQFLCNSFNLNSEFNFEPINEFFDQKGNKHIRYQQTLNNIPIEGMVYIGHFTNNTPFSANGTYCKLRSNKIEATISTSKGLSIAKEAVPSNQYNESDSAMIQGIKKVYLIKEEQPILCLRYDIYSLDPLDRKFVYINATDGNIEKTVSRIHITDKKGIAHTKFNGEKEITTDSINGYYRLYENGRCNYINTLDLNHSSNYYSATEIIDYDNIWDSTTNNYNAIFDAHFGTEMTYDYYLSKFGRNSLDNNGAALISYVNYGYNYNNAFWDGERMTYGSGDNINYYPLTCIDIVAHEITHGITQHTADLEYSYESGALNESFSDIFGVCIDFFANPSTANYEMGEQSSVHGTPFRSMKNPKSLGYPDTYHGEYWEYGAYDNGGVHINSSVQNYWFYLLAEGGNGTNDVGSSYNIIGIGKDKAAQIAYRTLNVYLSMYSQFEDAKNYSIQSAIDLFGSCSQEVISTTNAWYAVGIGQPFNNSVQASFIASQNFSCSYPVDITLLNSSINADSIEWYSNNNFIGNNDSLVLNITNPGYYDLKILAYGSANCNSVDTLIADSAIYVSNTGSPVDIACKPNSQYSNNGGISYFKLGSIDNSSNYSNGFEDFTCTNQTTLISGKIYPFQVNTMYSGGENVYVWLDANNNGYFDTNEKLYTSESTNTHKGFLMIPEVTQYNTPLRLRIGSDASNYNLSTACSQPTYGQYEDYSVLIEQNFDIPVADFYSSKTVTGTNTTVSFTDSSQNLPTDYQWIFEGGIPATSTLANPQVLYTSIGDYNVTLIASNQFGSDTIFKPDYIHVSNSFNMGEQDSTTADTGILYDSGGENGNYQNSENQTFIIAPPCADSLILSIEMFDFYSSGDYLLVYDGSITDNKLLWNSGSYSNPGILIAHSGKMTIIFNSNGYGTSTGFKLTWQTQFNNGIISPVANIEIIDSNPPFNTEVLFKDSTINDPHSWQWNINDEFWDFNQNTVYTFVESGQKFIELISTNCHSSDTVNETITVQHAPEISIGINSFNDTLDVGDSVAVKIPITNLALTGDLVVEVKEINNDINSTKIVSYNKSFEGEYSENENTYPYSYNIKFNTTFEYEGLNVLICNSNSSSYMQLEEELESRGANVDFPIGYQTPNLNLYQLIILDDQSESYCSSSDIKNFINNGGNAIFNGDEKLNYFNEIIGSVGISYSSNNCVSGITSNITQHQITDGITQYYINSSALSSLIITNNNFCTPLIYDYVNRLYSALVNLGKGNVLILCNEDLIDGNLQYENHSQLIFNYIDYSTKISSKISYEVINDSLYLNAQNSDTLEIIINTQDAIGGVYDKEFLITSNDTANRETLFPISLYLIGNPISEFSKDTVNFGLSYVGTSYTDSIFIENIGTDTLIIDSIVTTHTDFTVNSYNYKVPVGEVLSLDIQLSPTSSNIYNDSLIIYSNSSNNSIQHIRLLATSELPPVISLNVDSITEDMLTNDSIEHVITITNNGISPLIFDDYYIESVPQNQLITDKILEGVNILSYYNNTYSYFIDRINQLGGNYMFSSLLTEEILDTTDVLLITDYTNLPSTYIDMIRDYVKTGGSLFLAGDRNQYSFNLLIEGSGLSYNDALYCNTGYAPYIYQHPITEGIDSVYIRSTSSALEISDTVYSAIPLVKDIYFKDYAGASHLEKGRIVTIADGVFNDYSATYYDFEMKCIEWLGFKNNWLNVDGYFSDTLSTNETNSFTVKINALNLSTGTYKKNIVIPSNDPSNKQLRIPVKINVDGIGIISASESLILFDTIFNNQLTTKELLISNIGTENLHISNITSDNAAFEIDSTNFTIEPNYSRTLLVSFNPANEGIQDGILTIESDSKDTPSLKINLHGFSLLPPELTITPGLLDIKTYPGETVNKKLNIGNIDGNSELAYNISIKDNDLIDSSSTDYLTHVLEQLNSNYSKVNSIIPNRFNFIDGINGYQIYDGGSDMFDGGNLLYTNNNYSYINYSDNTISFYNQSGVTGNYFTKKYDGLFVFVGELSGINTFHVRGDLGSTPSSHDSCIIEYTIGSKHYRGFVARMYNYYNPSVNHLIIVEDNKDAAHTFTLSYDDYFHNISNLNSSAIVHHLLFASESGGYISNEKMEEIMQSYLSVVNPSPKWIKIDSYNGTVSEGKSVELNTTINTNNLDFGTYKANIEVISNDPDHPLSIVPVTLNVVNNQKPEITSNISNKIIYSCENDFINLNDYFQDPDGDLLIYTINNTNSEVIFPNIVNDTLFYFNPMSSGISEIDLYVEDGIHEAINVNFTVKILENTPPTLIDSLSDKTLKLDDEPLIIDLDATFNDPDYDDLEFDISLSDTSTVEVSQSGNYMIFEPKNLGFTIINISATDNNICSETITEGFILKVKQPVGINDRDSETILIYPNPATDNLFVKGTDISKTQKLEIVDNLGVLHYSKNTTNLNSPIILDISKLIQGTYYLRIIYDDKIAVKQFIKF